MSTSFTFRDILRLLGRVNSSNFNFTIETIRKSVDVFTGHGISKEYATKVKEEILPNQTVETLNAMIYNARSARGGFSHSLMNGRPPKVREEEEETK
jgi:hypothetical protein